ncbi:MAG: AAA family ATPase, partial [Bacteroidota bacterium]
HDDNNLAALVPQKFCNKNIKVSDDKSEPIIFLTTKVPPTPSYKVGRTSVLFSSLIATFERIFDNNPDGKTQLNIEAKDFDLALNKTNLWCTTIEERFQLETFKKASEETNLNFRELYEKALQDEPQGDFTIFYNGLYKEFDSWKKSLDPETLGTIKVSNSGLYPPEKFQLWRGWSPVEGYISLKEENQKSITGLIRVIKKFKKDKQTTRSLSCLVVGESGCGKSFLVESLAKQLGIDFLEFNITQLSSVDDLLSCFDSISSTQTKNPDRPLMVFWDEIDAKLNGEEVYSYFLSPIWNKTYRRSGQIFQLRPCIWIFAGSKGILNLLKRSPKDEKNNKASDFLSRINGPIINLHGIYDKEITTPDIDEMTKLNLEKINMEIGKMEQLYMAVSLVKHRFPKVSLISKNVLHFFKLIEPAYDVRSLEYILTQITNISHVKLSFNNLPEPDSISQWVKNEATLKNFYNKKIKYDEKDVDYVRIYTEPPIGY